MCADKRHLGLRCLPGYGLGGSLSKADFCYLRHVPQGMYQSDPCFKVRAALHCGAIIVYWLVYFLSRIDAKDGVEGNLHCEEIIALHATDIFNKLTACL